jgi:GNAT superfamily N-acetyltransferase
MPPLSTETTLFQSDTQAPVGATVEFGLSAEVLAEFESQWGAARADANRRLRAAGRASAAHHAHWRWDNGAKYESVSTNEAQLCGVRVGTEWQGAMSVFTEPVRGYLWARWRAAAHALFGAGTPPRVVYVDYIEAAPWNLEVFTEPDPPRYRGVGGRLMTRAVRYALDSGVGVGLFSLPLAANFYEKIGMVRLFRDTNRTSATRDLWYYEMGREAAEAFLARNASG